MTARNSDDAIASLMQEMGQQRGYDQHDQYDTTTATTTTAAQVTKINNDTTTTTTTTTDDDGDRRQLLLRQQQQQQQQLLIPELVDYPNNQFMAGSQSIWNPLVMSSDNGNSSGSDNGSGNRYEYEYGYHGLILPTNPQIEIIRRRVYEKFRNEVTLLLQDIEQKLLPIGSGGGTGGSGSFSKNKNKLPIPSMLDKWHMDSKLEEWNILKQEQQQQQHKQEKHDDISGRSVSTINLTTTTSTVDILRELTGRKQQDGTTPVYDPILLNKQSPTIFVDSILKPNVEKLWEQYNNNNKGSSNNNNKGNNNNNLNNLPPKFNKKSKQIHKGLYRLVCEANDSFELQLHQVVRQESSSSSSSSSTTTKNKKNNNRLPKISFSSSTDEGGGGGSGGDSSSTLVRVTYSGVTLKLHSAYLEKLQRLYDRTQQRRRRSQQQQRQQHQVGLSFEEALFCLLCRYDMIQGAGLQAGVPGSIMDILLKHFNCKKECFASPFNCRYETFSSAFYDIDFYFGSQGSFFGLELELELEVTPPVVAAVAAAVTKDEEEGICYQANPPFCEGLILQLNNKITDILLSSQQQQQQQQRPIMFVVFVPAWHESICYQALLSNKYLTQHLLLKQGQHWYAEGTQHRRKDSFRVASFDTSIFFYQNEAAKRLWSLQKTNQKQKVSGSSTDSSNNNKSNTSHNGDADDDILPLGNAILDELKNAFCQDPGSMQKKEQQQQQETSRINKPRRSNLVTTNTKSTTSTNPSNVVTSSTHDDKPSGNTTSLSSFSVVQRKRNKKATKLSPAKKERKRKWNQQEEGKAQLNLLESLGLSSAVVATTIATTTKSSQEGSRTVSAEDNNSSSKKMKKLRPGGKTNNKEKLLPRKMKKKRPHR